MKNFDFARGFSMNYDKPSLNIFSIFIILPVLTLSIISASFAASETSISIIGKYARIHYHPSARQSDLNTMNYNISRLNVLANLADHYLAALIHLGYIASDTKLTFAYSPARDQTLQSNQNIIQLNDLGVNAFLQQLNAALKQKPGTDSSRLFQEISSVAALRDNLPRRTDVIEKELGFTCLSDWFLELYPDMDFELVASQAVVSLRPDEFANHLVILGPEPSGKILLAHARESYDFLRASSDRTFLAFTEGGNLKILDLNSEEPKPIDVFENNKYQLLDMKWAPSGMLLGGIILDRDSLDRRIFVFDAQEKKQIEAIKNQTAVDGNYQFAYPYWAPNGKKLFFVTDNRINLFDIETNTVVPSLITLKNQLSEIIWAPNSKSFALVEINGRARDKQQFDDRDFNFSILHRYDLDEKNSAVERIEQQYSSSYTIKLVSFWSDDRILYLEGALRSPRISKAFWDLSNVFSARLTPALAKGNADGGDSSAGALDVPMAYCYAYKTMDSKFQSVYDSGMSQGNQLFIDRFETRWFLGLQIPQNVPLRNETYCLRRSPYPFSERNVIYFSAFSQSDMKALLEYLESYNLRRFELSSNLEQIIFLSNTRGILSLWRGYTKGLGNVKHPNEPDDLESALETNRQREAQFDVSSPSLQLR